MKKCPFCAEDLQDAAINDFFVNLLDMGTVWKPMSDARDTFEGRDRKTGELKWTGTRVDLVFGLIGGPLWFFNREETTIGNYKDCQPRTRT